MILLQEKYCAISQEVKGKLDFGVSTAILNTTHISRRWCKLNFGPLWGHVKSCYFLERIDTRRQCFYFFIKFIEIIVRKWLGEPIWIMIWVYYDLLTLSWRRSLSYRNQSIDLLCKSMDWFLYDNDLRHERVK